MNNSSSGTREMLMVTGNGIALMTQLTQKKTTKAKSSKIQGIGETPKSYGTNAKTYANPPTI